MVCPIRHRVRGSGQGCAVHELQGEALWVLAGGSKGGAEGEKWSSGIATSERGSWQSDEGEGEERERHEEGCSSWPHIR